MSRERDGSDDRNNNKPLRHQEYLIKIRGISNLTTKDEIKKFLYPCHVVTVHLFDNNGTSSSECFIELDSETDVKDALKKSGSYLDKKIIEVFRATNYEYNFHVKHNGKVSWREPVIRMSGLPFACTMADVQNFFENIEIARNGIYITRDMADKALGDGFVAFVSMDNAYKAIDMHDQKSIQHRYIELFPSTYDEAKRRIMNDARSNARQFVGEDHEDNAKINNNNNNNGDTNNNNTISVKRNSQSRSQSRHQSRSTSRDYRQREVKRRHSPVASPPRSRRHSAAISPAPRSRRHSPVVSPPSRSRPPPKSTNQRSYNNDRRRSRSRSSVRRSSSRNGEHLVKIRGMPYTVVEDDIRKFFPSTCQPTRIEIVQDRRMKRPNGDGYLYFANIDEVTEAMKYDRKYLGSRYIELYFDSPRYAALNIRRKKPESKPHHSSRSPSRSKYHRYSRSRSESVD